MPFCFEVLPLIMGSTEYSSLATDSALDNFLLNLFNVLLLAFFLFDFWLLYFFFSLFFKVVQELEGTKLLCF